MIDSNEISLLRPYSIESEQAVIGGILLDNTVWYSVQGQVVETDFYRQDHCLIFLTIAKMFKKNMPVDVVTLSDQIQREGFEKSLGGLSYLGTLAKNIPSVANIETYARTVHDRATQRLLQAKGSQIAYRTSYPEGRSVTDLLKEAHRDISEVATMNNRSTKASSREEIDGLLDTCMAAFHTRYESLETLTGVSTGFTDLDKMTCGLQPGALIVVAGRPSMGKTSFAMNMVENVVLNSEKSVIVFSLEMSGVSLIERMLSSISSVDQNKTRTGTLEEDDWLSLESADRRLRGRKLFIKDTPDISLDDIRSHAHGLAVKHGDIGLIVIDYMQLMRIQDLSHNRNQEISEISRTLKGLARELSCPVVAISQLNRSAEQRPDKRPINSDLRDSGAIEQDADIIMFVYRDEIYHPEKLGNKGKAEIIISKQRNGPTGTVNLTFKRECTRFENKESVSDLGYDF